jgi:hypothetical protein
MWAALAYAKLKALITKENILPTSYLVFRKADIFSTTVELLK